MKALIVVDMQNDFITGSLAVPGAKEIILPIVEYVAEWTGYLFYSMCHHPVNHCSFDTEGGSWPVHCVERTSGADIHPALRLLIQTGVPIVKGTKADMDEYSAFDNPLLGAAIERAGVKEVEICGLARDYCVEATAEAARQRGYKVTVLEDLCRAVKQ
jgi:nicotinamidase/pyrazinamidase